MSSTITALLVASCLVATSMAAADFCHGLDCPKYTLLNKTADWELRRYEATKWVGTNSTAMSKDTVNREMFNLLFQYISGKNEKAVKIPMTAPVLTKVIHGAGPNCESDFAMHFMLPHNYWTAPLEPTDPKVFLAELPPLDVFVGSFGGFANDDDYINNVHTLSSALAKTDYTVEDKYFFEAGYDGPYTFRDRHNEVWLVKV